MIGTGTPSSSESRACGVWPLLAVMCMGGLTTLAPRAEAQRSTPTRGYPTAIEGCWEASRALMARLFDGSDDRASRLLLLSPGGGVGRPLVPPHEAQLLWEPRSAWSVADDTVHLRVFTGLVGWDARLAPSQDGDALQGRVTYLTDAIDGGRSPYVLSLALRRVFCDPTWRRPDTSANHAARREEQPYYTNQVSRQPLVDDEVPPPSGVMRLRVLTRAEESEWNRFVRHVRASAEPIVVVSAVIEADGRVHASTAVVRESSAAVSVGAKERIPALLREARFLAAQREGKSVAVLVYLVLTLAAP